ncbi:MAG TPA: cytochrome c3 family protein [Anaeromyxobacter sp.]|nr:cytochrome c3 family protein [Anaeromyxobacter sp.]
MAGLAFVASFGCAGSSSTTSLVGLTPETHTFFPITSGDHALECAACHTSNTSFTQYSCTGCHVHDETPTDMVHGKVAGYSFSSPGCYQCHPSPAHQAFDHAGITGNCALCHQAGGSFAALPVTGFTHGPMNGQDCGSCHNTTAWATGAVPAGLVHDPNRDVNVTALVPSYVGTSISSLTARAEDLPMEMDHATAAVDATTMGNCAGCHTGADSGAYYPGLLHPSLADQAAPQPTTCGDCHSAAAPTGFVGPVATAPARTPASGEMKHDAVGWANGAPTSTRLVQADCSVCHSSPTGISAATWADGPGGGIPEFHHSLTVAAISQPASCLDCHANSRPETVLTSSTAALPAGVSFDHQSQPALGECTACHLGSSTSGTWAGGRYHLAGSATPSSCLPCHDGERPRSTAGWGSTTYANSPFDYGTNADGVTHGDGQDCAVCHGGPGTGAWGGTQNWQGGHFPHGGGTVAATTCIVCHMSQRPDLQPGTTAAAMATLLGFDHSLNGTGDCFGCHQATVAAGRYLNYENPSTGALPGGDWAGGQGYPGATLVSDPAAAVTLTELDLTWSGTWVTGFTSVTATLYGAMSHVSSAIPAAVSPGPASNPNMNTCWHCHTNVNGVVTSFAGGNFHTALASYSATPGGAVTPLPQPTAHCADCHLNMFPSGIVEPSTSYLSPMDHHAQFSGAVTIAGVTVTAVDGLDCSVCHSHPGSTWADGGFHVHIGGAAPQDCRFCHYPLMTTASADVSSGTLYAMSHRSAQVSVQQCQTCHTSALGKSTTTPAAATLWQPGAFHASLSVQPTACLDCHRGSAPTTATESSVVYALATGGTATNGYQWMSHAAAGVTGAECAVCHASDAVASGAAWRKSTAYHAHAPSPASCQSCHGLANGNGSTPGTSNNLPAGLTNSSTLTTASGDSSTGVPAGTYDQIIHNDVNVSGHDCNFCHTQVGPSTVAGIAGKEWAQAKFHASFSPVYQLTMNGTTGRCSNCHLNVKPGPGFGGQDHSGFTSSPGSTDCSACHTWPGTGSAAAPNWLGATGGAPAYITVGGFTIPNPPSNPPTVQVGIPNLPHPSTASQSCATCHSGGVGGKSAIGYDHASTLINTNCAACHEAGSDLVGTVWNGATSLSAGAGDTRPITIAKVSQQSSGTSAPYHFFLDRGGAQVDCSHCHRAPTGVAVASTGSTYTNAWSFHHPPQGTILNFCYGCHPNGTGD